MIRGFGFFACGFLFLGGLSSGSIGLSAQVALAQDSATEPPRDTSFDITAADRNEVSNPRAERERRKRLEERVAAILAGREGLAKGKASDSGAGSEASETSSAK